MLPRTLAKDIQHPEGPDFLLDGRVVFVETWTGLIKTVELGTGTVAHYANVGGGPNACCVESCGDVLVTQNGGKWHTGQSNEPVPPGIQRIDANGKVEHVLTSVDGVKCVAPNDLCFGSDGRLYFTDPGLWRPAEEAGPEHGPSYVFAIGSDGRGEVIVELGDVYPNGVAASLGGVVWGESHTRLIKRRRPNGEIEVLAELPRGHVPDGLKFDEAGLLWTTTVVGSTIDILDCGSGAISEVKCPTMPLNCLFVDGGLLVTDGGDFDPTTQDIPREGRLVLLETEVKGQPLFRGRI